MSITSHIFKTLKRILSELEDVEDELKKKDFEDTLKELRKAYLKNKKFFQWLKDHKPSISNFQGLAHGTVHIEQLLNQVQTKLMKLRHNYNDKNYAGVLEIIEELEKYVVWELKTERKVLGDNKEVIARTQEEVVEKIKAIDAAFVELMKDKGLDNIISKIAPTNAKEEKKKFLEEFESGKEYNPRFTFKPIPEHLLSKVESRSDDLMRQLRELNLDLTKGAGYILERKRHNLMNIFNLIRSIGSPKITKYSMRLYGFPSKSLIRAAYSELDKAAIEVKEKVEKESEKKKYSIHEFKKMCEEFLKAHKFKWKIVIGDENSMGSTRFKTVNTAREVWINEAAAPFSERDFVKAIEHEVMVHARRSELGKKHFLKMLGYGASGYLLTEEGLTHYFEALKDAQDPMIERKKYLYVIVEATALRHSFFDCVKHLVMNGVEPGFAWDVTLRIKRGMSKPAKAGGFMKDHAPFLGDKIVKEFIAAGGNPEELLFGKVGINDVKHLIGKYDISRYV